MLSPSVTRAKQQPQSLRSRRRRQIGSTNRGYWTLIKMESFTPLVFGTNSGMGADCNCFLKRLAEKLSEKNDEPYYITITWIRRLLSFEILRLVHMRKRFQDTLPGTNFHKGISLMIAAIKHY